MTYRYVTIMLLLAGKGPPATMLIFHPVCCMIELPHVASVRGSLLIALIHARKSGGFLGIWNMILMPENLCFFQYLLWQMLLGFRHADSFDILHTWPSFLESLQRTSLSWIQPSSGIDFLGVLSLGAQKFIPCGRYPIFHQWLPSISTSRPMRDMIAMVEASLAWLWPSGYCELLWSKHSWYCCGTNHRRTTSGQVSTPSGNNQGQVPCHTYCIYSSLPVQPNLLHWFLLAMVQTLATFQLFDNVWEKFFCSSPSLICFNKLSFVCFKPGMLFFISPRSARHPEWVEDELLLMPHWFLPDSGHSCGIQWNPEESNLAETPAKMSFWGTNIPVEWCHSWLVARMDKKECNQNAMTGIYITNQ